MCCFSNPIKAVFDTRIFARPSTSGRQYLVYQMKYDADFPVAMVLPLPVALPAAENSVRFLSLKEFPDFFVEMESGFPRSVSRDAGVKSVADPFSAKQTLKVESVGDYEASFVPAIADFARLDARFRLPEDVWKELPDYRDFGFAVFKLKPGAKSVHPIAFEFGSRLPVGQVFFPTVHIHDGEVHEMADYDHCLFVQGGAPISQTRLKKLLSGAPDLSWKESKGIAAQFMKAGKSAGTVDPRQHIYRLAVNGEYLNRDCHVTLRAM
jgi:hypothetical protein